MNLRLFILSCFFAWQCVSCSSDPTEVTAKAAVAPAQVEKVVEADLERKKAALAEKTKTRDSIVQVQNSGETNEIKEIEPSKPAPKPEVEVKKKPKKKTPKRKSPGIMTFKEQIFNYGKIEQGDVVMHEFTFVNTGKSELVINDIRASCGCTQPTYPFLPIAPGESGVIGVKFDSKGKLGKMKPMVTITTNAKPAINKIYLEGFVDAPSKKTESPTPDSSLIQ